MDSQYAHGTVIQIWVSCAIASNYLKAGSGLMRIPVIAISMGDAGGIGPELIVKVLAAEDIYEYCRPLIIADPAVMKFSAEAAGKNFYVNEINDLKAAKFKFAHLDVLCPRLLKTPQVSGGRSILPCAKLLPNVSDTHLSWP